MTPAKEDDDIHVSPTPEPVKALAAPRLRAARSLADAAPGDVLFLDRRGRVMTPRKVKLTELRGWALLGSMVAAVGFIYGGLFSPLVGVAGAAGVAALVGFRLRRWPAYRAAMALASTQRWEEARAALLALERKSLPAAWRPNVQVALGAIESLLGHPEAALEHVERAQVLLRGWSNATATMMRWRAAGVRAGVLARTGRLDEARRERDQLAAGIAAREARLGGVRSEFFDLLLQSVKLTIAFEADAPDELPDDETLHTWARDALLRTRFGEALVSLAWAFHRRGDDEMARHLLAEAPSRIWRSSLPVCAPRLHAWAEERRTAWNLAAAPG